MSFVTALKKHKRRWKRYLLLTVAVAFIFFALSPVSLGGSGNKGYVYDDNSQGSANMTLSGEYNLYDAAGNPVVTNQLSVIRLMQLSWSDPSLPGHPIVTTFGLQWTLSSTGTDVDWSTLQINAKFYYEMNYITYFGDGSTLEEPFVPLTEWGAITYTAEQTITDSLLFLFSDVDVTPLLDKGDTFIAFYVTAEFSSTVNDIYNRQLSSTLSLEVPPILLYWTSPSFNLQGDLTPLTII